MVTNSPNWAIIDLACALLGIIDVPIHTTYGPEYIKYIVEHTKAKWLIIEQEFFQAYKDEVLALPVEKIVVVDVDESNIEETGKVVAFKKLFIDGDVQSVEVGEDDVHTIIYTSGTTGKPKGVMLTHKNILSNVMAAKKSIEVTSEDRFFSFLPLSHALERTAGLYVPIMSGVAIYYSRDKRTMKDDIVKAKPTIMISVPRVFEKVYDAVQDKANHGSNLKRKLFYKALDLGTKKRKNELKGFDETIFNILDKIVLKKIRASLGGRIKFAISGGSALSPDIMQFFEDIGILILEGYGLTETSPVVSTNIAKGYRFGTVGKTLEGVEVKIAEDGEVLIRGELIMKGYYENEQATNEVINSEGWFLTGDLGELSEDGFLKITGRKKEMIVLSTGKNVAPVPIEQELEINRFILQAMVYGDNEKHISAIIVPDFSELRRWAEEKGIEYHHESIIENVEAKRLFDHEIGAQLNHFPEVEQIRHFELIKDEFTQENDLLTPTLKLKRNKILEKFL
jgi:long-chain acyl-CoA synthetase